MMRFSSYFGCELEAYVKLKANYTEILVNKIFLIYIYESAVLQNLKNIF